MKDRVNYCILYTTLLTGFSYGAKLIFQGNLRKTYFLKSWLRKQSGAGSVSDLGSAYPEQGAGAVRVCAMQRANL